MPLYPPGGVLLLDILDFGADPAGVRDSTAAIAAALAEANGNGGGTVWAPAGTYLSGNQTLYNNVSFLGAGVGNTIIKLKNGANADLFSAFTSSINLAAAYGSGSDTGVHGFCIADITLDGNNANNTSGYLLHFYGYDYLLQSVDIVNGASGGMLTDWHPTDAVTGAEARLVNVRVHDNAGYGIETGGPSDCQWLNCGIYKNAVGEVHLAPNASGIQAVNCHSWNLGTGSTIGWLVESSLLLFSNSEAEGEGAVNMVLLGDSFNLVGGAIYAGALGSTAGGLQIGQQSGQTPYANQVLVSSGTTTSAAPVGYSIDTVFEGISVAGGCIWFANDGGSASITAVVQLADGGTFYSGTPNTSTNINAKVSGITEDGTIPTSGGFVLSSDSFFAFALGKADGTPVFSVDTFDSPPNVNFNATAFNMLDSDGNNLINFNGGFVSFGTDFDAQLFRAGVGVLQVGATIALGPNSPASLASNGTIATAGVGTSKVTPAAAVTGVILQAGTVDAQVVIVQNISANTITFAAAATSHVAAGTSVQIPANRSVTFSWDAGTSHWL